MAERSETRRAQVGMPDRSEKIRTYIPAQDRNGGHRVGASFHGIPRIMDGELDDLIDSLVTWEQEKLLAETLAG